MKKAKLFAGTFVAGGVIGVIGQALMTFWGSFGIGELLTVMALLITLGLAGAALFATGLMEKAEATGSAAAFFPFFGLGASMARAHFATRESGSSLSSGIARTFKAFFTATGIGIAVSLITGLVFGLPA